MHVMHVRLHVCMCKYVCTYMCVYMHGQANNSFYRLMYNIQKSHAQIWSQKRFLYYIIEPQNYEPLGKWESS